MIDKQYHNSFMCSFDVDSMFTNVSLEETIDIAIKSKFWKNEKTNGLNKSKIREFESEIKKNECIFLFQWKLLQTFR